MTRQYNKREYVSNEATQRLWEKFGSVKAFVSASGVSHNTVRKSLLLGEKTPNGSTILAYAKALDLPFDTVADACNFPKNRLLREIYRQGYTIETLSMKIGVRMETIYSLCDNRRSRHISKTIVRVARGLGLSYDDVVEMVSTQQ